MDTPIAGIFRIPLSFQSRESYIEAEIVQVYQANRLTRSQEAAMMKTLEWIREAVRRKCPDVRCAGSVNSGFATNSSDLDIALFQPDSQAESSELARRQLYAVLEDVRTLGCYRSHTVLENARVPVAVCQIALGDVGFELDLIPSPYGEYSHYNSCLLRLYASIHPYVAILGVVIKAWARRRDIHNTFRGDGLSSYTFIVLLVAYLQRLEPEPLLPFLQDCPQSQVLVNSHDFSFRQDIAEDIRRARVIPVSLAGLLAGFFRFYSSFPWSLQKVDIRFGDSRKEADFQMVILDPFIRTRNLADVLRLPGAVFKLKSEFSRAYKILSSPQCSLRDLFE